MEEISRDEPTIDSAPQSNWVPSITVMSGKDEGRHVEVKGSSFTIGRSGRNKLVLNDKAVSRRHAAIEYKDHRYQVHDLESRWGLKVNGQTVKKAELKFGDEIEIAGIRLSFNLVLKDSISKIGPNWVRLAAIFLTVLAVAAMASLFYFKHQTRDQLDRPGADVLSKIIYHYDRGIQDYNQLNTGGKGSMANVIKEMKQVIELDPEGKTQFSRSARRIIDGLEK